MCVNYWIDKGLVLPQEIDFEAREGVEPSPPAGR